jgi:hypothetical protein
MRQGPRLVRATRSSFLFLLGCISTAGGRAPAGTEFDPSQARIEKRDIVLGGVPSAAPLPGEDFAGAIAIDQLPFTMAGSTCEYRDDVTPACTFLGGAPDLVFTYTPPGDVCVEIDLCASAYDTAVHVYDKSVAQPVACNDDFCGLGSKLTGLELSGGHTYYIVVDGWYTGCGDFALAVHLCPPPCGVDSMLGQVPEGEPWCTANYYDRYNTGCNDYPYVFSSLPCQDEEIAVRGTYGTWQYYDEEWRDTDWYRLEGASPTLLDYEVMGGAMTQIAILDGSRGCPEYDVVCGSAFGGPCEHVACQAQVPPGTYFLFVAPRTFTGVPCGTPYLLRVRGHTCDTIGVEPSTWSQVKQCYR